MIDIRDIDVLKEKIEKIKWWHTIDFGNGIKTPGQVNYYNFLEYFAIPESLEGLTVLDIGAWDGFFSFEAERHGAKRVLATDSFCWRGGYGRAKAGFDLAKEVLNSKVEEMEIDVLDLNPERVGTFDVVLFLGVLYHMRHPLLALEKVFSVTKKQLILETHIDLLPTKNPVIRFYPGSELANDPTNWWGPNPKAVKAMLLDVGFRKVEMVSRLSSFGVKPLAIKPQIRHYLKWILNNFIRDRMVFYAFR